MDNINAIAAPNTWLVLIIAVIVVLILYVYTRPWWSVVQVDHRSWAVANGYSNKQEAAKLMAATNSRIVEFLRFLKHKYHVDEDLDKIAAEGTIHERIVQQELHRMVAHLLRNYNPDKMYENDPRYSQDTSYTINKGRAMYLCLRSRDNPDELVDPNTLVFVVLHECAHIANYSGWGHDKDYWSIFKWLLEEAVSAGLYRRVDYAKTPVKFCGVDITYQPLDDSTLTPADMIAKKRTP